MAKRGRPKGSKNKPKLSVNDVRSVPAVGSRTKRLKKTRKEAETFLIEDKESPTGVLAWHMSPVNRETGHPLSERVDAYPEVTQAALEACFKLAREYGYAEGKDLPPNVEFCIHAIRLARDLACAVIVKDKAEQKMLVSMLAAWGRGDIPGKVTAASIQDKIDGALQLAKVEEDRGNEKYAETQRKRAARLQQELDDFNKKDTTNE